VPKVIKSPKIHFISGLPRSGSTLLGALLGQNPRFHGSMSSPVGSLVSRMLEAMSEDNEFSVFITPDQKRALTLAIFSTFYESQADKEVIFMAVTVTTVLLEVTVKIYLLVVRVTISSTVAREMIT